MRHVAVVGGLLTACGGGADPSDTADPVDPIAALVAPGSYGVGYRELEVQYNESVTGDVRILRLPVWYPSSDTEGTPTAYQGLFDAPGVWSDATLAEGTFPLVVFSHGHQGYSEVSGFLLSHFASRGWIVAAPEHTGNTSFDSPSRQTEIYFQRPLDVSATLDFLTSGLTDDPLVGRIEGPTIGIGHSFGGYTLLALGGASYDLDTLSPACVDGSGPEAFCATWSPEYEAAFSAGFLDPRLDAHIVMAPGDYPLFAEGLATVERPVLHLSGGLDPRTPDSDALFASLVGSDDLRVHIRSGGHQTFTDYSGILEDFEGLISADDGFHIVKAYATAFAEQRLGDDTGSDVLSGRLEVSDEVELSTH
jgi:predicted dienelactone hydrolase